MSHPALLLTVKAKSKLSLEEVTRVMESRMNEFRALEGLKQKYYVVEPSTGEIGGVYLWESVEALDAYRESALRATIAEAYQTEGEPRVEVLKVIAPLRDRPL